MEHKELLQAVAPIWDYRGGVYIPLLDCVLQPKNLSTSLVDWPTAMKLAQAAGGRLFTREEALILAWQKDTINELLFERGGAPLSGSMWTSSEDGNGFAWCAYFSPRGCTGNYKSPFTNLASRAVVAYVNG